MNLRSEINEMLKNYVDPRGYIHCTGKNGEWLPGEIDSLLREKDYITDYKVQHLLTSFRDNYENEGVVAVSWVIDDKVDMAVIPWYVY
jgi:hypothetical protein